MPLDTQKVEILREKRGLTQEQAAKAAGLKGKQNWSNIVNQREGKISLATLERIADALQCDPCDLILRKRKAKR